MRIAFTKKRGLYLLAAFCCAITVYFYPFLSSSMKWMLHPGFRYENSRVKLPFRWVSSEGGALILKKSEATISSYGYLDSSLAVHDHGPNFRLSDEIRSRAFHDFGITESRGSANEPTYPFTAAGFACSRPDANLTDWLVVVCLSSGDRYLFTYIGTKEEIREASEIAKQIVR